MEFASWQGRIQAHWSVSRGKNTWKQFLHRGYSCLHDIWLCPMPHQRGKRCFFVPNSVKWRANQVENIQLKHILSFKIMSVSSLISLRLSSNLHWNSPALITSRCHQKGTQHFGTQTAKLLSSFSKCSKQTLIFWSICSFTEPYFNF